MVLAPVSAQGMESQGGRMTKDVGMWTRKEFEAVPARKWNEDVGAFDSLIILPMRQMHDSGYRCMDFIAVRDSVPVARLSGCSDVIHIGGIGGFNCRDWVNEFHGCPDRIKPVDWSVDCLRTSGLLRLFSRNLLTAGEALSSFELYAERPRVFTEKKASAE